MKLLDYMKQALVWDDPDDSTMAEYAEAFERLVVTEAVLADNDNDGGGDVR